MSFLSSIVRGIVRAKRKMRDESLIQATATISLQHSDEVVWMAMVPIGSYICTLGLQLAELFGRD